MKTDKKIIYCILLAYLSITSQLAMLGINLFSPYLKRNWEIQFAINIICSIGFLGLVIYIMIKE